MIGLMLAAIVVLHAEQLTALPEGAIFSIGEPNSLSTAFRGRWWRKPLDNASWGQVVFTVGKSQASDWPYIHPSSHDAWAGSKAHTFAIRFHLEQAPSAPLYLTLGLLATREPSRLTITINGQEIASQRLPNEPGAANLVNDASYASKSVPLVFPLAKGVVTAGDNIINITLDDGGWMIYDYVLLGTRREPPKTTLEERDLRSLFAGPMTGVEDIIFAERRIDRDSGHHWYDNFGYYVDGRPVSPGGGRLCRFNLRSHKVTVLLDDPKGGVRDPQVSYDAKKILFSYRKGNEAQYHLYEIGADGSNLRQLTFGAYDDFEPTYLPNGEIMFVSSRANRWVPCWFSQVANLYRCDAHGGHIRPISSNPEQENTPWPLPDGRILYTRWEYVDRSEMVYHHLWAVNPDGTGQKVFFGNQHAGTVMIDAKPIPNSDKIVASFSPDHGLAEHAGSITIVDPRAGPDEMSSARDISRSNVYRDPWAFSADCFMAARGPSLVLMNGKGQTYEMFRLSRNDEDAGYWAHEPRPLRQRSREPEIPDRARLDQSTGRMILANVYEGRNMAGVKPGEIGKLLILEPLPMPVHYWAAGPVPISYHGTWLLERILGTVPVEPDGSAYFEAPAMRSLYFVALDEHDLSVKRMQSFVTLQPGETTGCVGCHEWRTRTSARGTMPQALRNPPHKISPIAGMPEIFDYPRDIQPVLDALCVKCHGYDKTAAGGPYAGRLILSGDRGPTYSHSYYMMTVANLFSDGRNLPKSEYPPYTLGSSASRILKMLNGSHYGVVATERQKTLLRLWIESGAVYPGTYAALGTGRIGDNREAAGSVMPAAGSVMAAAGSVVDQRCATCHNEPGRLLPHSFADGCGVTFTDERAVAFWPPKILDLQFHTSREIVFNLSRPEKSLILLAPLAEAAGGWGLCRDPGTKTRITVFASTDDPDYQKLLAMCVEGQKLLEQIKRFDMPGFSPRKEWVREMQRYGILSSTAKPTDLLDVYAVERQYWESLWYQPVRMKAAEKNQ